MSIDVLRPRLSRPGLRFDQCVPRQLAHRRATSETFVCDTTSPADGLFLAALQLPRAHSLWHDHRHGYHDPLLLLEACRQATFVGFHRHLDVSMGTRGSLQQIGFSTSGITALRDDGANPLEAVLRVGVSERTYRDGALISARVEGEAFVDDKSVMSIGGLILFMTPADFGALRAFQRARKPLLDAPPPLPEAVDPSWVGRYDPRNMAIADIALAPESGVHRFTAMVEPANPAFFDHAQDHLPGTLIVEIYRQSAIVAATRERALSTPTALVTDCQATFADFAEFEGSTECHARVDRVDQDGKVAVTLDLHQFGARLANAAFELTPMPNLDAATV